LEEKTPFWLSRLKAGNLLQAVAKYPDFPLIIETYRNILQDYFDLAGLREVLHGVQQGKIGVHRCQHQTPSPFASGHLFNFIGNFMYEGETPRSELRFQMFGLGRETLKIIIGKQGFRKLFDRETLKAVEAKARGVLFADNYLTADLIEQWLEKIGDICFTELEDLFPATHQRIAAHLHEMIELGKAVIFPVAAQKEFIVSKWEAPIYLKALPKLTSEFVKRFSEQQDISIRSEETLSPEEARRSLIHRYVRNHGPFQISTKRVYKLTLKVI